MIMPDTTQSDLVERLTKPHSSLATQSFLMHEAAAEITRLRAHCEALEKAIAPFLDLGPQRGAWGVISKKLDDFAPMTVTVTKVQMLEALAAYRKENLT